MPEQQPAVSSSNREVTRREQQREQTRLRILRAAIHCFTRSGFTAASMSRIAQAAGVKKALVQYHFTTKDSLWQAAASLLWEERNARLAQFMAIQDVNGLADSLRPAFTAIVEFTREHPEWMWLMFHEAQGDSPRARWLRQHFLERDYELGVRFVRGCQQQGLMRDADPLQLLHLITGALTYNLLVAPQTRAITGTNLATRESIDRQVDLLLAMLAP
ncbi:TetR family transcriptional regulator [Parahaliea maris]|uniref:TetR family transcriptional regulator n=1 Tax=Parahaliea maris TaxID=2716870 RepID=A0A5C8ZYZ5_9GAMM|nr:TetR/AcrR family transcriptional regulator [Parahaliea maris]TXS92740.1 TetR family transcriptional regulator [Parahaliea maris]